MEQFRKSGGAIGRTTNKNLSLPNPPTPPTPPSVSAPTRSITQSIGGTFYTPGGNSGGGSSTGPIKDIITPPVDVSEMLINSTDKFLINSTDKLLL